MAENGVLGAAPGLLGGGLVVIRPPVVAALGCGCQSLNRDVDTLDHEHGRACRLARFEIPMCARRLLERIGQIDHDPHRA